MEFVPESFQLLRADVDVVEGDGRHVQHGDLVVLHHETQEMDRPQRGETRSATEKIRSRGEKIE